jgi:hypothetical protein
VADALLERDAVAPGEKGFELGPAGPVVFAGLGIDLTSLDHGRRPFALSCLDWSERRPHIAGALGAAIASRALAAGWIRRHPESRALDVTEAGREAFAARLGLELRG